MGSEEGTKDVLHVHLHVFPRYEGDPFKLEEVITGTTLRGIYSVEEVKHALTECGFTVLYDGPGYAPAPVLTVFVTQKQST